MGRRIKKVSRATGTSIASASAAIRAFSKNKSVRRLKLSVMSSKSTAKVAVKDIKVPHHVSAAEVNKILAARGRQISETLHKEEQAIAKILEDTAKQISKVHGNFHK